MRQHGHTFGRAIVLDAATHIHPGLLSHLTVSLGHANARDPHTMDVHRLHIHLKGWGCARSHQARQPHQQRMIGMQPRDLPIILDAQPQFPALAVGQTNQRFDQVGIRQPLSVAFEFDGEGFPRRQ